MLLNNDYVKLVAIVAGAIFLFVILNKYNILPSEGYDTISVGAPATVPVTGVNAPVGMIPTGNQIMPSSAPPLAPVQATSTQMGPMDPNFAPQPVDDKAAMAPVMGAWNQPKDCYPKDQLTASDLLPADTHSRWNQVNPEGSGDLSNKNFLSAGYLSGIDTQGSSLRNASFDIRGDPEPNPQVAVSPFLNSTITPDKFHRPFEIGGNC